MITKKLTYHTDPAHGWIEVTRADIDALGIAHLITPYSYMKDKKVFLEEDCDAYQFMESAKAKGWILNLQEKHTNNDSFVRSLNSFKP